MSDIWKIIKSLEDLGVLIDGVTEPVTWDDIGCLRELSNVGGSRSRQDLLDVWNGIKNYFETEQGQLDWQYSHTRRTWKEKSKTAKTNIDKQK